MIRLIKSKDFLNKLRTIYLILFNFFVFTTDIEVSQFVIVGGGSDDTQEITQLVLLEVLLGEVLQVSLGERLFSRDDDLLFRGSIKVDLAINLAGLSVDLDVGSKEALQSLRGHNTISNGSRAVDGELGHVLLRSLLSFL